MGCRWVLVGLLVASRVAYWWAGVRFDGGFADGAMQLLDRDVLAADPFGSAWYLHIQPPLFNLAAGLVFRMAGGASGLAFQVLYLGLTVALVGNLRALLLGLGLTDRWATGLTAAVMVSPSVVQFENLLFYTHVEVTLLVVAARCIQRERPLGCAACLTVLVLSRALYHPLWLVGLGALLVVAARRVPDPRWALAAAVAVPLVAGLGVGVKNQAVFGWFTTSSFEGLNLHRMTERRAPEETAWLLGEGTITEASLRPYFCAGSAEEFPAVGPDAHHPALDRRFRRPHGDLPNYNHRSVLPCARRLRDESLAQIREAPRIYLRQVGRAFLVLGYPPTPDLRIAPANRAALAGPARVEAFLLGAVGEKPSDLDPATYRFRPTRIEWVVVLAGAGALVGLTVIVVRGRHPQAALAGFLLGTLGLTLVLAQFTESGENSRFRFVTDPLLVVAVALLARARSRRGRGRGAEAVGPAPSRAADAARGP